MRGKSSRLYLTLILSTLFLASLAQSKVSASDLVIKIDSETKFPATFPVKEESGSSSQFFVQPELSNESYLFSPLPQVSFTRGYPFQVDDFKYNDVYAGKNYHYYQTAQRIFMTKFEDKNMKIVNFVDISVPDIMFSQQSCTHVAFDAKELYSISACKDLSDGTTYLVMIAYLSSRPAYVQSLKTSISETVQMKLVGQTLYVLDRDATTGVSNKLHAYKINLGSAKPTQQAMEILGYIDSTPFQASELNISSFDASVTERKYATEIQKIFLADSSYGLRTIDLNCETGALTNAFSNDEFYGMIGVAIKSCNTLNTCDFVITLQDSTVTYAQWIQKGDKTTFSYYRSFLAPAVLTQKMIINKDFLIILTQKNSKENSLLLYSLTNEGNNGFVSHLGAIDYEPLALYGNDFSVDCLTTYAEDGSCKVFVPNPVNHLEEFIVRSHFSVIVQNDSFQSTYLRLLPRSTTQINIHDAKVIALMKATNANQYSDLEAALAELLPKKVIPFVTSYSNNNQPSPSAVTLDGTDDTSDTTVHGWFIIFLIIVGGLAAVAYYTVKADEKETRNSDLARSSLNNQQQRRSHIEENNQAQRDYKLMTDSVEPVNGALLSGDRVINVEENGRDIVVGGNADNA